MKDTLYTFQHTVYETIFYENYNLLGHFIDLSIPEIGIPSWKPKYGFFTASHKNSSEEEFVKNFANPLCAVFKQKLTILIQKEEQKLSLKVYHSTKSRGAGKPWFNITTKCEFLTINLKTGDVFQGQVEDYHKKRKVKKVFRKNFFYSRQISLFYQLIKNKLNDLSIKDGVDRDPVLRKTFEIFFSNLDERKSSEYSDSRLLKFYLDKKGVKYPNNFHIFYFKVGINIPVLKDVRKFNMNLVDSFMNKWGLKGKVIKNILHDTLDLKSVSFLSSLLKLFPETWVNTDKLFIIRCLNNELYMGTPYFNTMQSVIKVMSNKELRNLFTCIKLAVSNDINLHSVYDHVSFYSHLLYYGEEIKWKSNDKQSFHTEHLDWSDKVEFYKKGFYQRIYQQEFLDYMEMPIVDKNDIYYPKVLVNSTDYNHESAIQNNCVKTYIGRPSSIIISINRNDLVRATIELFLYKVEDRIGFYRPQSLGKFNSKLDDSWDPILETIDTRMDKWLKDPKKFQTIKLEKILENQNKKLFSDSEWGDDGKLYWTYKSIVENQTTSYDFLNFPL